MVKSFLISAMLSRSAIHDGSPSHRKLAGIEGLHYRAVSPMSRLLIEPRSVWDHAF